MLSEIGSVVVNGAMVSAIYVLFAVGFTMIFGVAGVLNLAHGALIMAGAYTYLCLVSDTVFGLVVLPGAVAFPITLVVVALLSYGLYRGLVQFLEENVVVTFLATLVVAILATEVVLAVFHAQAYQYQLLDGVWVLDAVGTRVLYDQLLAFGVSWLVIGLLWYYVTKTDGGRSILATSMSERGARITGVDIDAIHAKTWLIAGALAGLAGIFLGATASTNPEMWLHPLGLAFIIVVVGGIGSIKGSIVAAYLIGFLQTATGQFVGQNFRGILSLLVLIAVLLFLPQGLYGRDYVHE